MIVYALDYGAIKQADLFSRQLLLQDLDGVPDGIVLSVVRAGSELILSPAERRAFGGEI